MVISMPSSPSSKHARPTISVVAKRAGVSQATAARALGGYGYVSDSVREKVRVAAASLGYRADAIAKSMVTGRTETIGVVVADISNPFFGAVVKGISEVARHYALDVLVIDTDEDLKTERSGVQNLISKRVDALIVASAEPIDGAAPHLVDALDNGIPLVLLDRYITGLAADSVSTDSRAGVHRAVRELIDLGHRRIGLLWGPEPAGPVRTVAELKQQMNHVISTGADRVWGYLDAHQDGGIAADLDLLALVPQTPKAGERAVEQMLSGERPPSAIVTTDSVATLSALTAIRASGLSCPEDVSLYGFDDTPWAAHSSPPITMLDQSGYALGSSAARKAITRIGGDDSPPSKTLIDMTVVTRNSLSPGPFAGHRRAAGS